MRRIKIDVEAILYLLELARGGIEAAGAPPDLKPQFGHDVGSQAKVSIEHTQPRAHMTHHWPKLEHYKQNARQSMSHGGMEGGMELWNA